MDCTGCGSCCTDQRIPLTHLERKTTPVEDMNRNHTELKKVDGLCVRLDPKTRRCTKYDERPQVCQDFKPGCGRCVLMRAYAERHLGGIGAHPLPAQVKPGSYLLFTVQLEMVQDKEGNVTEIRQLNPDYPTQLALDRVSTELPSQGF